VIISLAEETWHTVDSPSSFTISLNIVYITRLCRTHAYMHIHTNNKYQI